MIPYELIKIYSDEGFNLMQYLPITYIGEGELAYHDRFNYNSF